MTLAKKNVTLQKQLLKRHKRDRHFKWFGWMSIYIVLFLFTTLLTSILFQSWPIFWKQEVQISLPTTQISSFKVSTGEATSLLEKAFHYERKPGLKAKEVVSLNAWKIVAEEIDKRKRSKKKSVGRHTMWLPIQYTVSQAYRRGGESFIFDWLKKKEDEGRLRTTFNWTFFSNADSVFPETAGIFAAFMGTIFVLLVAFTIAFPIGVVVAIYMECFMRKDTKLTYFINVNINNLAAVPSIIFGLLGMAIFLNFFELPRSSGLVGGLTLSLMMMPIVIVSSRMALSQVPENLKEAALGLGASKTQAIFHHVVPGAMPGIITGTLLSLARMMGDTAPLIMVGMVVFLIKAPMTLDSPATVLPVQIYQWFQRPEPGFIEASSGAIVVLLLILLGVNSLALLIRRKFEKFSV